MAIARKKLRGVYNCLNQRGVALGDLLAALVVLFPVLATLAYIAHFGVNVPFSDQWTFLKDTLQKYFDHSLTLRDLFSQHNEHRIFFPRLIMIGLALATNYNTIAEMYFGWLCVCATSCVIFSKYRKTRAATAFGLCGFIPIPALLFSWRQAENWLWGIEMVYFLPVLAAVCSFAMLERSITSRLSLPLAVATGTVASFSFFNGLLVWPIGLWLLWTRPKNAQHCASKYYQICIWGMSGLIISGLYLWNYVSPSYHPSVLFGIKRPLDASLYLASALGSALMVGSLSSVLAGFLLLALGTASYLIKGARDVPTPLFWDSLIFFSFLSAVMVAIGRAGFGIEQALSSRYTTFTILGVVGLYVRYLETFAAWQQWRNIFLFGLLMIVITSGLIVSYRSGIAEARNQRSLRQTAVRVLLALPEQNDASIAEYLFPNPAELRQTAAFLPRHKLSVFAGGKP